MWSVIRSLSFKLTVVYIISIFLIVGGTITYVEYWNNQKAIGDAVRQAEVGPGFINYAMPNASDSLVISGSEYALNAVGIDNRLKRFNRFFDATVEGGVSLHTSIDGPISSIGKEDYYNITFKITNIKSGYYYEVGPVTIPKSNFAATIAAYSDSAILNSRLNDLYYLPVSGHDNLILVVSMNQYAFPVSSWQQQAISGIFIALPWILISSVAFGLLISWITVSPLKRITRTTELMSRSDLSQRVKLKSGDEIGLLANSFNIMADRLADSFNSQKRFISDAAHELRTPLASMKTSVTKALSSERNSEEYQKLLSFLSGRIDHMETLVNDLLFLSRIDEGKFKLNETRLDLSAVVDEAGEAFRYLFEDKGIVFAAEVDPDLYVKGDHKLMLRVISNLLDNAAKNTPSSGSVSLRANKQDKDVILTVSDTGSGIPPEHLSHIFERFYKVPDSSGAHNGYGLGLAISKSIVVASGGEISVRSEPSKSSLFTIKLPTQ